MYLCETCYGLNENKLSSFAFTWALFMLNWSDFYSNWFLKQVSFPSVFLFLTKFYALHEFAGGQFLAHKNSQILFCHHVMKQLLSFPFRLCFSPWSNQLDLKFTYKCIFQMIEITPGIIAKMFSWVQTTLQT